MYNIPKLECDHVYDISLKYFTTKRMCYPHVINNYEGVIPSPKATVLLQSILKVSNVTFDLQNDLDLC